MPLQLKPSYRSLQQWIAEGRRPQLPAVTTEKRDVELTTCRNCGMTFEGNFCPNCGQKARTGRLKLKSMIQDALPDIWNLDNRFVRTVVELVLRPGHMIRNYVIDGRRHCYYSPISLLFLLTALYMLLKHLLFGESVHLSIDKDTLVYIDNELARIIVQKILEVLKWLSENMAWVSIFLVLAILFPVKWCFRSTLLGCNMNLTEYFYLLVYMACQSEIFSFLSLPYYYIRGISPEINLGFGFLLGVWVFKQFFQISWVQSIRRYLCVYLIMAVIPMVIAICISIFVD